MGCDGRKPCKTRIFHIFLRDPSTREYEACGRVEVIGDVSASDVLELYRGGDFYIPRYHYLIQEEGSEVITPLTVEPHKSYVITAE